MKKIERIRKTLIFFIIVFIVTTILTLLTTSLWKNFEGKMYTSSYTTREMYKYPCLTKGEVCTDDDIERAIKTRIQVSDSNSYEFYLLSNDENTATFIMASNIEDAVDWQSEGINIKGPVNVFTRLLELTKDWNKVPLIENYEYIDEGYEYYKELCSVDFGEDPEIYYDCTDKIIPSRGYKKLVIENGKTTIYYNLPEEDEEEYLITEKYTLENETRARLIELKEIDNLVGYGFDYPDWLIDNLREETGYWTMSSSTMQPTQYMRGAWAISNYEDNKPAIVGLYTKWEENNKHKIGIRPVITIPKEEKNLFYTYE